MMQGIDVFMYFYFLIDQRVMGNFEMPEPPRVSVGYCDYTTSHVISNEDMYSLDEIDDIVFGHELKGDK